MHPETNVAKVAVDTEDRNTPCFNKRKGWVTSLSVSLGLAPPPVAKTVSMMEAMNQQSKPGTGQGHNRAPTPKSPSG